MKLSLYITAILAMLCLCPCYAQKQHGKASFYSKRATGARTASGQRLHHDSLTCAHRFYPFGTHLKVTNLGNGKSVIVKVIDRGPFGRGRIIDLSWAAAKKIGMISQGVASVKVEMVENPVPYRPEEIKLPKVDFEVAESDFTLIPKWKMPQKKEKPQKVDNPHKDNNIQKEEKHLKKEEHHSKEPEKETIDKTKYKGKDH